VRTGGLCRLLLRISGNRICQAGDIGEVGGTATRELHLNQVVQIDDRNVDVAKPDVESTLAQLGIGRPPGTSCITSTPPSRVENCRIVARSSIFASIGVSSSPGLKNSQSISVPSIKKATRT
jgi:hypothetical protein